jgi:hypothetical protein
MVRFVSPIQALEAEPVRCHIPLSLKGNATTKPAHKLTESNTVAPAVSWSATNQQKNNLLSRLTKLSASEIKFMGM